MGGDRVAIVTNSGGPAIVAVDALQGAGLTAATFSEATRERLRPLLPAASHLANPLDLLAGGTPAAFEEGLRAAAADPGVDAVLAIWTPLTEDQTAQAEAIARAFAPPTAKPCLAVLFGHGPGTPAFERLKAAKVPVYSFPENAVRSLAALRAFAKAQARPEPTAPPAVGRARAAALLAQAKPGPGGWLAMRDALALLAAYGIRVPRHALARDEAEAERVAADVGFPCVLKMDAPGLVHKTEAGAVRLGLATPSQVRQAFAAARDAVAAHGFTPSEAVVMEAIEPGPELLVGATQDPLFGPVVACGAGGIYTEILQDVRFRLAPIDGAEATRLLASLRIAPLLRGARGASPSDMATLADTIVRLGQLAADFPAIAELEANPVRALPDGAVALDARIRLDGTRTQSVR
jgi:acetyltransferase